MMKIKFKDIPLSGIFKSINLILIKISTVSAYDIDRQYIICFDLEYIFDYYPEAKVTLK